MPRPVKTPFRVRQVFVCQNRRDPETGKASCAMNGSVEMRERLKAAVKERGLKGQVMVSGSSCLDHCPPQGCTVAIWPENAWMIVEPGGEDEAALLARIVEGAVAG